MRFEVHASFVLGKMPKGVIVMQQLSNTRKLTISAVIMAAYLALMYVTQGISFGAYQIRIATAMYGLAYVFPFLAVPFGLANMLSNLLYGGLGVLDIAGGFCLGVGTGLAMGFLRKHNRSPWWIMVPIWFIPGLGAPLWLSYLLHIPYVPLAISVTAGQVLPGIIGALMVRAIVRKENLLWNKVNVKG